MTEALKAHDVLLETLLGDGASTRDTSGLPADMQAVLDEGQRQVVTHIETRNSSTVGRAVDERAREVVHEIARSCSHYESSKKQLERAERELAAHISEMTDLNAWLATNGMTAHAFHDPRKK